MTPLTSPQSPSGTSSLKAEPKEQSRKPASRSLRKQVDKFSAKVVCSVVHEVPGRVRFRVPRLIYDADYARRLQRLLEANPGIKGVRVNRAAGSIAIDYDRQAMTPTNPKVRDAENYPGGNRKRTNLLPSTLWMEGICKAAEEESDLLAVPMAEATEKQDVDLVADNIPLAKSPVVRACSLEVRQAIVPAIACGLLQNRKREPLKAGSLVARLRKLQRLGILFPT